MAHDKERNEHAAQPETTVEPRVSSHWKVAPASSVNDQLGDASFAGEDGAAVIVGAAGAIESSTYVTELLEHGEVRAN